MSTAREDTYRLADLLCREHHALADFLIALATFDRERRWSELGYASLFDFLRRELKLSAGAAQYAGTTIEETRLGWRPHQDVNARRLYGDDLMNNYTVRRESGAFSAG